MLTYGLSSEYADATREPPASKAVADADRSLYSRYFLHNLLRLDEVAIKHAWMKAQSSIKTGDEKESRLQYLSWRIWFLKRRKTQAEQRRAATAREEGADAAVAADEILSDDETATPSAVASFPSSPAAFAFPSSSFPQLGMPPEGSSGASLPVLDSAMQTAPLEPTAPLVPPRLRGGLSVRLAKDMETMAMDTGACTGGKKNWVIGKL